MKKGWIIVIALLIIIVLGVLALIFVPGPNVANAPSNNGTATTTVATTTNPYANELVVDTITAGTKVTSPLTVTGKARGWYFEGSFPIQLKDATGKVIAQGPAQAQTDWMTSEFASFKITLTFAPQTAGSKGTLVLMNDNPSGLPQNQKEVDIPIQF